MPELTPAEPAPAPEDEPVSANEPASVEPHLAFSSLWEFAVALNKQDPAALAVARNGAEPRIVVDGTEVRKLLTTVWFRSAFERLSEVWRDRLLDALVDGFVIPNHPLKSRRGVVPLQTLNYAELKEIYSRTFVPDVARVDVELLLAAGRLWGADALGRFRFADSPRGDGVVAAGGAPAKLSVVGSLCSTVCGGNVPASRIFQHFSGFRHDTEGDGPLPSGMAKCLNRWVGLSARAISAGGARPAGRGVQRVGRVLLVARARAYAAPSAAALGVAFVTSLLFFLQLRIADEFKDFEEDARFGRTGRCRAAW